MSQHKQLLTEKQLKLELKAVQKMYLYKYLRPINDLNEKLLIRYIFELEKQFRNINLGTEETEQQ